jgi:hypothetical protein
MCNENKSESPMPEFGTSGPAPIGLPTWGAIQLIEIGLGL